MTKNIIIAILAIFAFATPVLADILTTDTRTFELTIPHTNGRTMDVEKFMDGDNGNICYVVHTSFFAMGISCLPGSINTSKGVYNPDPQYGQAAPTN